MRKAITLAILIPSLMFSVAGKKDKKKKNKKGEAPQVGWVEQGGDMGGSCYHAPDFSSMPDGPKRMARSDAQAEMIAQWRGEKGDGVQMSEKTVYSLESVLLGDMKDIDAMVGRNLEYCQKYFAGEIQLGAWDSFLTGLPAELTAGECKGSLLPQTLYDYLNIGGDWHIPAPLCKDDEVVVEASPKDYYQIEKGGPWINAEGDTAQSAPSGYPCTLEGCYKGTLLLRFVGDSGMVQIVPVGTGGSFRAPEHGKITVMINDTEFFDNNWKVEGGLQHHTSIGYLPK